MLGSGGDRGGSFEVLLVRADQVVKTLLLPHVGGLVNTHNTVLRFCTGQWSGHRVIMWMIAVKC